MSGMIRVLHFLAQTGAVIIMGRYMGPDAYGIYAYWLALIVLITTPVRVGTAQVLTRYTASYQADGDAGLIVGLWRRHIQWIVLFALVCAVAMLVLVHGAGALLLDAEFGLANLSLVLLILLPLADSLGGAVRGLHRTVAGQIPEFVVRPLGFVLLLLFVVWKFDVDWLTPYRAMALYVASAAGAAGLAVVMARSARPVGSQARYREAEWFRSLVPLSFAAGMFVVNAQIDVVLLGWLSGQDDVGVYRIFGQGAMSVLLPTTAFNLIAAPQIARLYQQRRLEELQKVVRWQARAALLCVILTSVTAVVFGRAVIDLLLGSAFVRDYGVFVVLVASQLLNTIVGPVALVLNMTGKESEALRGIATAAVVNVIANLVFIPIWGMMGAAAATMLSVTLWSVLLHRAALATLGINCAVVGRSPLGGDGRDRQNTHE